MRKLSLFKALLVAVCLLVGSDFAWGETIGNTTDAYLAAKSTSITLTDGGSVRYVFTQTTANTAVYQGFILAADKTDGTELVRLRQDNFEVKAWSNEGCSNTYPSGWDTSYGFFNGATIDMTVTYSSGTFSMSSTIYGSDNNEYNYEYTKDIADAPSSLLVYLGNDHAKLYIGTTAVSNSVSTTTTYDFLVASQLSESFDYTGASTVNLYLANSKYDCEIVPNTKNLQFDGALASYTSNLVIHASAGIYTGNGRYIAVRNLQTGDQVSFTYNSGDGKETSLYYQTRSGYGTAEVNSTELTTGSSKIASGDVVTITSGTYLGLQPSKNVRFTSMTVVNLSEEERELFTANRTLNTSYRVSSTSNMSDGKKVKSVYGITMTYHGNWTWTTARNGNAQGTTAPTLVNNMPTTGDYWEFKPTTDGTLTIKAAWFGDQYYELTDENGNIVMNYRQAHNQNDYESYVDYGSLVAGKTYYFFRTSITNGYYLGGFTFTPEDNTRTSYTACNGEIIKGGYTVNSVAGITMTYGGTSEDTWNYATDRAGAYLNDDATVSGNIPTGNTYVVFNPSVNGILTIRNYFFLSNGNCHLYLSDGTDIEDLGFSKGSGSNGNYTNSLSTLLKAGDTYYVYFADGYGYARFQGFTFTPTPATVTATIGATGFATFSSEYPLDFSATMVKAYSASLTGESTVLLSPVTTAVPANTGLLLKGTTEDIPVKAGFGAAAPATNLLKASKDEDISASVEGTYHYVLANGSNGVGFYNLASDKNIGTGKAYLETATALASASEARVSWYFADDTTTDISQIEDTEQNKEKVFYNMNGQRIAQPQRGLYIVRSAEGRMQGKNGKKIIIK